MIAFADRGSDDMNSFVPAWISASDMPTSIATRVVASAIFDARMLA